MIYKQKKIKFKPRIKLNHNIFITVNPLLSPPPLSTKPHSPLNDRLYYSITTVKHRVDGSGMVCSPTGSSYLFLIFNWLNDLQLHVPEIFYFAF